MEQPLQLMVELQGDSLVAPSGPNKAAIQQRVSQCLERSDKAMAAAARKNAYDSQTCSYCDVLPKTLRKCSACKQAQYCRRVRRSLAHALTQALSHSLR